MAHKHEWSLFVGPRHVFSQCACGAEESVPVESVIKFIRARASEQRAAQRAVERHKEYRASLPVNTEARD